MPKPLDITAGFIPYSDGSGYQVDVRIQQEAEDADVTLSIETCYRVSASDWPTIRDGIDRLLSVAPKSTTIDQTTTLKAGERKDG